jgi:cell division protein FtsQ
MQPLTARREPAIRRDPAPSRWHYRVQRWMLTPGFHAMMRLGVPLLLLAIIGGVYFGKESRRAAFVTAYQDAINSIHERPEFMVTGMAVTGADAILATDVQAVLLIAFPVSSFDLDLETLRGMVEAVPAVASATLRVEPGGILSVAVTPRQPIAIWRTEDGLKLIDASGFVVSPLAARSDRADLPLIAGDGAKDAIEEALALYAAAGPVAPRVRGLVRMGERRWDVVLDRDQRILLPTEGPIRALERVIVMAQTQDLLERDVSVVDMRNQDRPTIRLNEQAVAEMRRVNASVSGTGK